jgi:putative acetyltransferase
MNVTLESPDQPEVIALIAELDAYQDTLYPPESRYATDLASIEQANVLFAVARDDSALAIGCGAIVFNDGYGELKRMYVRPGNRGRGLAKKILAALEAQAMARDCRALMLETGPRQPEAIGLYELHGYVRRGPFGTYKDDPLSVFMQKHL